jgi:hypothetical protein
MGLNDRSQLIPIPPLHDPTITFEQTDGAIGSIFGHSGYRSYLTRKITGRRDCEEPSTTRAATILFITVFPFVSLFRTSWATSQS